MHCPPDTPSPWQGKPVGFSILKNRKKHVLEGKIGGKIHMKFRTKLSICTIFIGNSHTLYIYGNSLWYRGSSGRSPRKLMGFSVLKAQENPFQRVRSGVKFTCNFTLSCQFVLFSSKIPSWLMGLSDLKAQENLFQRVKFT